MPHPNFHTDHQLLTLIAANDEQSFHSLYLKYSGKVYAMALRYLHSAYIAQDVVQEVFSKVWEQRKTLPAIASFDSWLTTVTKNLLINELKKAIPESILKQYKSQDVPPSANTAGPVADLDYRELERLLHNAIQQLSPRQREVYELNRNAGLAHKDIAEQLGISYDMTREHMSKALKNIRALLEKHYGPLGVLICLLCDI